MLSFLGHIAFTNDPTEAVVMWVSNSTNTPIVQYGIQSGKYKFSSTGTFCSFACVTSGTSASYTYKDMCSKSKGGESAKELFWDPGQVTYIFQRYSSVRSTQLCLFLCCQELFIITGLGDKIAESLIFRYGTLEDGFSEEHSFISAQTDLNKPVRFIAFGDSGTSDCERMQGDCSIH